MDLFYILGEDGKTPVSEPEITKWALWFQKANRQVGRDEGVGDSRLISTIFLGIDHGFNFNEVPILFETMIFEGEHDRYQDRYATWDEAVEGHARAVALVKGEVPSDSTV